MTGSARLVAFPLPGTYAGASVGSVIRARTTNVMASSTISPRTVSLSAGGHLDGDGSVDEPGVSTIRQDPGEIGQQLGFTPRRTERTAQPSIICRLSARVPQPHPQRPAAR